MTTTTISALSDFKAPPDAEESETKNEPTTEVEFLTTGIFWDKNGRKVVIDEARLDKIAHNFASGAAKQEIPVDILHQRGEAAGWVREIFKRGRKLIARIVWNPLGVKLIKEKRFRYVSATLADDILKTISLVNLPAVKEQQPLSLSETMPETYLLFADDVADSFGNRMSRVRMAYYREFEKRNPLAEGGDVGIVHVYEDFIIVENGDEAWKIPYSETDGQIIFAWDESQKVKLTWSPLGEPFTNTTNKEIATMSVKKSPSDKMADDDAAETEKAQTDQNQHELGQGQQAVEMDALLAQLSALQNEQLQAVFTQFLEQSEAAMQQRLQEFMQELQEQRELLQFCESITSTGRHALPFKPQELYAELSELPANARERVVHLLQQIADTGLVDLTEHGTSAQANTVNKLPDEISTLLSDWVTTGNNVDDFFAVNPELGDKSNWDLSEFTS